MIKKRAKAKAYLTPNANIVISVILLMLSIVFSLSLGQKAYDADQTGFAISYFLPGAFALLAIADASIEYIDSGKKTLWSTITSIVIGLVEAGFGLYAGVAYFTKYPQIEAGSSYKTIAFATLIVLLILNLFSRNLKYFKALEKKTQQIPLIISAFFLGVVVATSFALTTYDIHDLAYSQLDKLFPTFGLYTSSVFAIGSLVVSFIEVPDKAKDYALTGLLFLVFVLVVISILIRVNVSEFTKDTYYLDYWQLMSLGYSAISLAFPIGYMGYLISKKREG